MSGSRKRSHTKTKAWIWKAVSAAAVLYLIGLGIVWLLDLELWRGPVPTTRETATIHLYFSNSKQDAESLDCGTVYPVGRSIPFEPSIARETLSELLKGPRPEETEQGYYSSINEGVHVLGLVVSEGTARVDFDTKFDDQVAGSCQVEAIRAQITRTLTQFPSIQTVVITVAGQQSEAFQP